MSNTIDEKVVEMRFDNKDFETNIKDTMKTLDEFKKQLKFEGASDGFDNISKNAGKINFNGLSDAIDTVKVRFSALEVMGITALTNITNSAVNAGKRIVDSLTIAPIKSGYEEYELTLNTIKTVMNATNKSAKDVERQLKSLDDYADKTIYSTADMFTNISKFTNVGVPLEDASTAMIGIANATALAGRGAREASIAMYNLGQAIGVGYLNRIDYKSLQNAGIDTNEWKEAMIDAALAAGTLTKAQDGMYKSGNKLYTMQNLFIDGLQTQWATRDVMMKVLTDYGNAETDIGAKAWKAAQEVRTFSGMMEALKASVGTGWKETWQLLFGDLDEATKFWTRINDFVSGIIGGFTKKRNEFLQGVLDPISPLLEKIGESSKAVKETVDAVKDYANVVDEIISGKWGNGQSRWDKLTEAGYDWAHAQNLVNERLGSSVRYSTNFSESQENIITSEGKVIDTTGKYIQALSEMDDATLLSTLGDEEKAKAVRDIQKHADKLGLSVEELVNRSNELSGRTLIIESIANIGNSLVKIFESVGKAWRSVFSPISADTVYDIVAGLYKFSNIIKSYVEANAENLTRTLRGLFSILSVIANIVKGVLNVGFTAFKIILGLFGKTTSGVLSITGSLGDVLYKISEILNKYIISAFDKIVSLMNFSANKIKELVGSNSFLADSFTYLKDKFYNIIKAIKDYVFNNENLNKSIEFIKNKIISLKNTIADWLANNQILNNVITGLSGAFDKASKSISNFIKNNETIQTAFNTIKDKIDNAKESFKNWASELNKDNKIGKSVSGWLTNFGNIMKTQVSNGSEKLTKILNKLFTILGNIGNTIKSKLNINFNTFKNILSAFSNIANNVLKILKDLSYKLYDIGKVIGGYIITSFENVISLFGSWIGKIRETINNNSFLSNSFSLIKEKISNVIHSIKDYISNNDILGNTIETLKTKIIELKDNIVNWFENNETLNTILDTFHNILDNIVNSMSNFIQNNETIQNVFNNIKDGIDKAKTSLENWFNTLNEDHNVGKNIVDGIANGIKYGAEKVWEAIKKVAQKIKEVFCNLLGIHSPSTVFTEYGKNIIDGLINGLRKMFPNLTKIFEDAYNAIKNVSFDTISSILFSLTSIIPQLGFLNLPRHFANLFKACGYESIAGLIEGLKNKTGVFKNIYDLATNIINKFKELLGINSPSKVFMEFGKNIIDGLINGIKNGFTKISNIFNDLGNKIVEGFKKINFGNIAAIILATSMFVLVGKLIKFVSSLSIDIAKGFADSLKAQKIQAEANKIKSTGEAIKNIGITIALIAASIFLISKIKEPWKAFAVIGAISGCVVAMYGLITLISHFDKLNQASKGTNTVLKIAGSILLIAIAVNLISKYKIGQESIDVIVGLITILGLFIALIRITMVAGPNADKAGDMILKISASILLMIVAIKLINSMTPSDIFKAIAVIDALAAIILALIVASGFAGKYSKDAGLMFLEIAGAILILTYVIKLISKMENDEIYKGIGVIAAIGFLFYLFITKLNYSINDFKSIGIMALAMSASLVLIVAAIKMISSMTVGELIKGGVVITALGVLIGLFVNTLKASGSDFKSIGVMVLTISGAILLLVGALILLTKIDAKELYARIPVILAIGVLFGKLIATANSAKNAMGTIITLTVALSMLIGAVALLTLLDQDKLKNATICVVALMGVLSVLIGVSKFAGGLKQTLSVIPMLILVLGMSIGAIYLMSLMDTDKALSNVTALSILLGALTIVLLALKLIKSPSVAGLVSLGALTAIVLALTGILYLLQNIDATKVMPNVIALGAMLLTMTAVLAALTIIGLGGPAAIIGVGSLAALVVALTGVIVGLGALVDKFPQLETFIYKGQVIFVKLGEVLGNFIGAIINGVTSALMDILPTIGTKLSEFMVNIMPFIVGIKMVDGNTVKSAGFLALAIAAISAAEVISGIASFLSNGQSLSELGTELTRFMLNAMPFFIMVESIKPETLQGVEALASAILALTKAELIQGITKFISGGTADISQFGSQLGDLAGGLNDFVSKLTSFNPDSVPLIKAACEAITAIAEANNSIPNTGGWLANIIGDNKIDDFGDAMPKLGAGLNGFVKALGNFGTNSGPLIDAACEAIKKIADTNNSIPNTGGLISKIIGDNDIGKFGEKIATLGEGLNSFVTKLSNFTTESQPIVNAACDAIKKIADLGNSIGDSGWYSKLIGDSDLEKFSKSIPSLGEGVNGFVTELQDFSSEKVSIVESACSAITTISGLGDIDLSTLGVNLKDFGYSLTIFGSDIYSFTSTLEEVGLDTIEACVSKVNSLITMANTIASVSIESLSTFSTSLVQVATDGVNNFCLAFSGEEPVEQVKQAIIILIDALMTAIDSKKQDIYNKFKELMDKALEAMKSKKQEFTNVAKELCEAIITEMNNHKESMYNAGADFTMGFVEGMRSKIEEAARVAAEMARAALQAAKAAIDSNSPSKETMALGGFFGEGFMLGIKSYSRKVYNEAYDVGDTAKDGLSRAISKISSIIDSGIETSPTIRPVLDLSNLESGVSRIDSMFNNGSVALNGNIDSISNNFKLRSQNGLNNSVEEAINNLSNKLQGLSGNTLNIYTQELDSNKLDQIVVYVDRQLGIKYLVK